MSCIENPYNRFQALTDEEFEKEYENIEYLYN